MVGRRMGQRRLRARQTPHMKLLDGATHQHRRLPSRRHQSGGGCACSVE